MAKLREMELRVRISFDLEDFAEYSNEAEAARVEAMSSQDFLAWYYSDCTARDVVRIEVLQHEAEVCTVMEDKIRLT
jgi:hypothetical protein